MTWFEGVVLGFLQGATEFLPVSSSGHLVMGQAVLGIEVPGVSFEVALHLATLVSVLIVYRERVRSLLVGALSRDASALRYIGLLLLASIPAAIAGVGFGDFFEGLFDRPWVTGVALIGTGFILWTARWALDREPGDAPDASAAVIMGLAQAFAIVPGISRSGSTVIAALWKGVSPIEAAAFSFLMSVPAIAGAALLKAPDMMASGTGMSAGPLWGGALVACVTGVLAIRTFVAMLASRSFHRFAPYLWAVGLAFLWFTGGR